MAYQAHVDSTGRILNIKHTLGTACIQRPTRPDTTIHPLTPDEYTTIQHQLNVDDNGVCLDLTKEPGTPGRCLIAHPWRPDGLPPFGTTITPTILTLTWSGLPVTLTINREPFTAISPWEVDLLLPGTYRFAIEGLPWKKESFKIVVTAPLLDHPPSEPPRERPPRERP